MSVVLNVMWKCLANRVSRAAAIVLFSMSWGTVALGQDWRIESFDLGHPSVALPSRDELSQVRVDPAIREQVGLLNDDSYAVREQAMQTLTERVRDLNEIYAVLEFDALSPEQRYRLLSVVRDSLVRTPRGAIGISMNQVQFNVGGPMEIRVIDLIPGLPGERVLKVGDRIVEVDGKPLMAYNDLQVRVQSKKPGDKVRLKIKRTRVDEQDQPILDEKNQVQVEMMELDVELGSADRLGEIPNQLNAVSPVQMRRQEEAMRVAEMYAPRPRSIGVKGGLSALLEATARRSTLDDDIDRFPAIQALLMQRKRMGFGDAAELRALRMQWQQRILELQEYADNPTLSPEEREFMQRVIERYVELMQ